MVLMKKCLRRCKTPSISLQAAARPASLKKRVVYDLKNKIAKPGTAAIGLE